ncbi:MAG: hypothetical protein K6G88_11050 [Lachnospiraceae bacterium]|nr:hypothetical protein [Lachnospiraceae bacterium]
MKKFIKGTVLSIMIGILSLTGTSIAKAEVNVYFNVEQGMCAYVAPTGTPRWDNGSMYHEVSWGDTEHVGKVTPEFITNRNLHCFEGVKLGHVCYEVNESDPYQCIVYYHIRVHNQATGFVFDTDQTLSDQYIYLYEGSKVTLNCTTLPFNKDVQEDGNIEHMNAIQGIVITNNKNSEVATAVGRRPSWRAPSYLDIDAKKEGDTEFTINSAGSAVPTGITKGSYFKGFTVHVRKKPEINIEGTKVISLNKTVENAAKASITCSGTPICTWTSSNTDILEVVGSGENAKFISKGKEGKVKITCTVKDEVALYNPSVKPVSKTIEVEVKNANIELSGIRNGDTFIFPKDRNTVEIPVSEVEGSTINWTSSLDNVANVDFVNGKLVLTKKGVGTTEIVGISSTGNIYKFKVHVEFVPETPKITNVKASYGTVVFNFEGTLYDCYELECGTSSNDFKLVASTKNKFASINLDSGTYFARIRSCKEIENKNVYSNYSEIVTFTVSKDGDVVVVNGVGKTKIVKAKRIGKKVTLKLKKVKNAKGYQIKYSFSKKFKKSKKVFVKKANSKIKIKKAKKVFIRARAYKVINGKKKYGKWSKVKIAK